jgi:Nucleotidyltransferase domain
LTTVVVKSVDVAAVRRAVEAWVGGVFERHPEVEEVVVFGSFADGRWAPGSDLDVFLTLSSSDRPVPDRVAALLPGTFPVGIDIFPFTREEIAARAGSPLLDAVARSGWRYARPARSSP